MAIELQTHGGTSPRPDPRTITSLPEILSSLSNLEAEETELSNSLSELLSDREPIIAALTRLQSLEPRLNELYSESYLLSGTVSATAKTADRVGGRVRLLDEEMKRVREAGERVGQVMELKVSFPLQYPLPSFDAFVDPPRSHPLWHCNRRWKRKTGNPPHDTAREPWLCLWTSRPARSPSLRWSVLLHARLPHNLMG